MNAVPRRSPAPLSDLFVDTTQANEAFRRIDELMDHGWEAQYCKALLLFGPTRSGKSFMVDQYIRRLKSSRTWDERCLLPVVLVEVPAKCTLKSFASEVLHALQHPDFDSGTLTIKTTRIAETIGSNGVRLLVVDEVQRLIDVDTDKVQHDVSTWLTAFLNKRVCPLLLVGEPRAVELFDGNYIRGRTMGEVRVGAYDWADRTERDEFRHFLFGLDANLGLPEPSGLHADLAYPIHQHAQGLLGLAAQLVSQARLVAWRLERPKLTLDLFAEAVDMLGIGEKKGLPNPFRDALDDPRTTEEQVAAVMAKGSRRRTKR